MKKPSNQSKLSIVLFKKKLIKELKEYAKTELNKGKNIPSLALEEVIGIIKSVK